MDLPATIAGAARPILLALLAVAATSGPALAGDRRHDHRGRDAVDPRRGQADFLREGLGPGLLPYTRQGPWGVGHRYPRYPLFHAPIPAGPGDRLYETGRFPWQRG